MAKTAPAEDTEDEGGAANEVASPGVIARTKAAIATRVGNALDAAIGVLQRQRAKLAPPPATEGEGETEAVPAEEEALPQSSARHFFRYLLIGTALLLIGGTIGGWLSFKVFAQKIERQGDLIADQADEVAEYRMDAERAERARDDAKAELRDVTRELDEVTKNYQDTKTRLAEIEGRMLMYGGNRTAPSRPAYSPYTAPHSNSSRAKGGECQLSSVQDLSHCLSHK